MQPGDHLFRRESGPMAAALTRILGVHNLALAEDVVQDAFCRALEFLCAAFEGPVYYSGREMKLSHKGMGITEAEWAIFMAHVADALDSTGVAPREKTEFLQCADGLKWDIVEVPASAALGAARTIAPRRG